MSELLSIPELSIVSPVYGAPELIESLVQRLEAALTPLGKSFEVLLVNDGCPRNSWSEIERLAATRPWLVGINLSRNFGQHFAISAGLDHARGEWTVVMDCDLQDQPEEIPKLLNHAQTGFDVVFGRREERKDSLRKTLPGVLFSALFNWLSESHSDPAIGNFSICHRNVINAFCQYRERDRAYAQLVTNLGFRQTSISIEHAARPSGESSYSFRRLLVFSVQSIVSGSNKPLRLATKAGIIIACLSLCYAAILVIRYWVTGAGVAGWTTLAVMIPFFSGLILVQLGVLGLYLGKTFNQTKNRPLYHVQTFLNRDDPA